MGWVTAILGGLDVFKAFSDIQQSRNAAKSAVQEGNIATQQKALQVRYAAAKQTSAFLASGITLDGTPRDVQDETFATGKADVKNIGNQYNQQSKNLIASGRAKAIGDITDAFKSFAGGSSGGSAGAMYDAPISQSAVDLTKGGSFFNIAGGASDDDIFDQAGMYQ